MKIILWFLTLLQVLFCTLADLCLHLLGGFFILCADRDIGFQLRFGAGGAHHNGAVIFQQELEHIGLGQTIQTGCVIQQLYDLLAAERLDVATECLHDALHLGEARTAVELIAVQGIQAVATDGNTMIQRIEIVIVKGQPYRQALDDTEILMYSLYFLKNTFDINSNSLLLHTTNKCRKAPIIQYPTAHMPSPTHELGR